MFDCGLVSADDAAVVTAIEEYAASEARAAARRIAAIAELVKPMIPKYEAIWGPGLYEKIAKM